MSRSVVEGKYSARKAAKAVLFEGRNFNWCGGSRKSSRAFFPRYVVGTALVRDPYAGWCGRRGAARLPPIPIIRHY